MSSRDVTILVWAALALALAGLEVAGRLPGSRVPTFRTVITRVMRTPSGRVGVLAGWLWIGLHYFSR
jgi:hypothetical protein